MSKYNHPLHVLNTIHHLNSILKQQSNSNFVEKSFANKALYYVVDTENEEYFFKISGYELKLGNINFSIEYRPESHISTLPNAIECTTPELNNIFKSWFDLISAYRAIPYDTVPNFDEIFQDEYFEAINIDEDGDTKPFNHIKMLTWHNILEGVEETIQSNNDVTEEEKVELIAETKELKESLSKRTQKSFAKGASKLFAKIKSTSISLMKEVGNEITKRMAKAAIDAGAKILKDGPQFMHDISQHYLN